MDFIEIAKSWLNSMNPTPELEEKANHRINICNSCEKRSHVESIDIFICSGCGCPIKKKIYSPKGKDACPLKKWEQ